MPYQNEMLYWEMLSIHNSKLYSITWAITEYNHCHNVYCDSMIEISSWSKVFVYLFGVYRPGHSRIFHSYGDVIIAGEGLQILTYARHSWPLSSEGSLTCHTYCDTGLPFIMVISEDPWHSHLLPSVWQWSCHYLFYDLGLSRPRNESRSPTHEANALPLRHRGGWAKAE